MSMLRFGLASILLTASAAFAGTPQQNYDRLWNKYTSSTFFDLKPRVACVCFDGVNDYRLGSVVRISATNAACYLYTFDVDGDFSGAAACSGPFSTLAR
jgi:hypothetical protein